MIYRIFFTIIVLAILAAAIIANSDSKSSAPVAVPSTDEPNMKGLKIE